MERVYADLIVKGLRTIESVPEKIREKTRQELIDRGRADLAGEDTV